MWVNTFCKYTWAYTSTVRTHTCQQVDSPKTFTLMVRPVPTLEGMSWNCSSLLVTASTSLEQFSMITQSVTMTLLFLMDPVSRGAALGSSSEASNPCWKWRDGVHTPTEASCRVRKTHYTVHVPCMCTVHNTMYVRMCTYVCVHMYICTFISWDISRYISTYACTYLADCQYSCWTLDTHNSTYSLLSHGRKIRI